MSYRYSIGTNVAGRTIVAQLEHGARPGLNIYRIRYACCDRESTIQEQSLNKVLSEHNGLQAFCTHCRKTNASRAIKGTLPQKTPDSPPIFATWPAPPSSVHRP